MNFKTTIILIVLLAAAGVVLWFNRNESPKTETPDTGAKLVDIDAADVTKVIVTPSDGAPFTLEKTGTDWRLTEPVNAPAETFEVDSLVRAMTDAKTRGKVNAADQLSRPHYQVQLVTATKTVKLAISDKSAVGDALYVQVDGNSQADIIGTDLSDKLDKGADAYRKMGLVSVPADQINQITIARPGENLSLKKTGHNWEITEPTNMPADESEVGNLTYALAGLRAESFVDPKSVPATAFAHPQLTVAFSTQTPVVPPATAPATEPPPTIVQYGSYDDILKKNVFVTVQGSGFVAKVPATSLDSFKKTPLDLRDKKVVNLDPDQVSRITLLTELPSTTQPTTRAAVNRTVTIERRKVNAVLGPALPSTQPTTMATTAPVAPSSKWIVTSDHQADGDDAKVSTLLTALHPLNADKYLESMPTTQPAGRYVLTITTVAAGGSPVDHKITLIDPGHDQPLMGSFDGLSFETSRTLLTDLEADWIKK